MPPPAARLFHLAGRADGSDGDLLAAFVAGRDEEAFAALVRRHGSLVLGVCRRVTGHPQDAEDAFQAAFLVLARRAGHVRRPELLGNWLYGVAVRTAREAVAARRRRREQPVPTPPDTPAPDDPPDTAELRAALDDELARLPEKYRAAVVLCELEGLSRKAAAGRLRVPEGTLSSRLAYARKVLADRLSARGFGPASVGLLAVGPAVSPALAVATARFAAGGVVPAGVLSLTDGVLKAMLVTRLRLTVGAAVMACGLLGVAAAAGLGQRPGSQPPARPPSNALPAVDVTNPVPDPTAKTVKVEAKGIEDDDVPYPTFPGQAVVRIDDGKLVVRTRAMYYEPVTETVNGQKVTSYQRKGTVTGKGIDAADVAVFDVKGSRLAAKAWKDKLKADTHVVVSFDGRLPHPRELALFRDDVLVVVFPGASGADAPPAARSPVAGYQLRTVIGPDGRPQQYYEPALAVPVGNELPPLEPSNIPPSPILPDESPRRVPPNLPVPSVPSSIPPSDVPVGRTT